MPLMTDSVRFLPNKIMCVPVTHQDPACVKDLPLLNHDTESDQKGKLTKKDTLWGAKKSKRNVCERVPVFFNGNLRKKCEKMINPLVTSESLNQGILLCPTVQHL